MKPNPKICQVKLKMMRLSSNMKTEVTIYSNIPLLISLKKTRANKRHNNLMEIQLYMMIEIGKQQSNLLKEHRKRFSTFTISVLTYQPNTISSLVTFR